MNEIENGSQIVLYEYISSKLASGGLSRGELESIMDYPIGHSSVRGFVDANLRLGYFQWRGEVLVNTNRKISVGLTKEEEVRLEEKANEVGLTIGEFATNTLLAVL
ncbi:hypothetical protein A2V56_05425 [Candidatus Woesebacteria bacterium RBG_19FT_COMBO_42_9]|uniref:Uncharacterized protein n=1 Tax=Candidatus Woesebacteria bacterium RBG_16_42_24 TaxID=1802485 RepID=A0A1F7XM22_9BACT|nr:MAG: hypothetical protein A2V97_03720 [Candidatus Woesebacteria bacterium RBG_16_42_24]OGM17318.1 MAG: hypothetical protein A2V56_05425 [Candidatus Woesebacteria bacterium RBG_19FT_COMBO_42_9]OGM67247.1 MAG: hypothetical protein A2985_03805 [Candidatus Woesebacteria bacterium RIFCSPLOWO2_01_FULL_43_11]